jgi:hypothetical protein
VYSAGVIRRVAEFICLVYHEARNVRHPLGAEKLVDGERYFRLTNLPRNRMQAWRVMAMVRESAATALGPREAAQVFERQFGLKLWELEELYRMPIWRSSAYGGNPWAAICSAVTQLIEALEGGDEKLSTELLEAIPRYRHNTGTIRSKLQSLQSA